jgi:ELWxxDGT repeat protein
MANTPGEGYELWRSDGTAAGTTLVKDIIPGPEGSFPNNAVVADGMLYFAIYTGSQTELWKSDGTGAGTVRVDAGVTDISRIVLAGTDLHVVGRRGDVGEELFMLPNVRAVPFTISQQPTSQSIASRAPLTLTVATTSSNGTPLYQWRRNGLAILGATAATYRVTAADETHQGTYEVLIRMKDYETLSQRVTVTVAGPLVAQITTQPADLLLGTAQNARFEVAYASATTAQIQWYKGTTLLAGETGTVLNVPAVSLASAGYYKATVTNAKGTVSTRLAQLAVVSKTDRFVPAKLNAPLAMPLEFVGTGLQFVWAYDYLTPYNTTNTSSETTSTLRFAKVTNAELISYVCIVKLGGQTVVSGRYQVRAAAIPLVTPTLSPPSWNTSQLINLPLASLLVQSNLAGTSWNAPTSFTISALPKGLRYDAATRSIVGRLIQTTSGSVTLTITATNIAGSAVPVQVTIPITALATPLIGSYGGLIDRNLVLNKELGQSLQFTITNAGALSGKIYVGSKFSSIIGALDTTTATVDATAVISVPRLGTTPLTLNLAINGTTGAATGSLTDGATTAGALIAKATWTTTAPATAYAGTYTAGINTPVGVLQNPLYPQGYGTITGSISSLGVFGGTLKMPDGVPTTFSIPVGNSGAWPFYVPGHGDTSSVHGLVTISTGSKFIDGTLTYFKAPALPTSTTRSFKNGYVVHNRGLVGGPWSRPTTPLLLGVTDTGLSNVRIYFDEGGISSTGLVTPANPAIYSQLLRVTAPSSALGLATGVANPGKLTISMNTTTGEFSGKWLTTDANPVTPTTNLTRSASFSGVVLQRINYGTGFFSLPTLPAPLPGEPNAAKTPILSGNCTLQVPP